MTEKKKEKSCLINSTIIGAMEWYLTAPASIIKEEKGGDGKITWQEKAYQDLLDKLNRVPGDFPEAARQGVNFEKKVYAVANQPKIGGSAEFQKVCELVKGYQFGQKAGVYEDIDGHRCYLFVKYDAIKNPVEGSLQKTPDIIDLKTTASYKQGKYCNGFQHKLYCYVSGAEQFRYVVAEWEEYPKIKDIHIERFNVPVRSDLEVEVKKTISEFLWHLKDLGLWEIYKEKYCLY